MSEYTERVVNDIQWCNWSFDECLVPRRKWLVTRDCDGEITLTIGDSRNWRAYKRSLEPHLQYTPPVDGSKCPKCHRYVNGVNPYDDGETWRK